MKIEDLKVGDVLIGVMEEHKIIAFTEDYRVIVESDDKEIRCIHKSNLSTFNLKPQDEYIEGFEVRKYDGEIVEVRGDDFDDWVVVRLIQVDNNSCEPFETKWDTYKYARPVPQDKRKFLDIK